jgi:hypothetical protein
MAHGSGSFLNGTTRVVNDFIAERARQNAKHPETDGYPDGTHEYWSHLAGSHRMACDRAAADGTITWRHVLREEVYEAFAETDVVKLREELVQVMAVAGRWVEALDARPASGMYCEPRPVPEWLANAIAGGRKLIVIDIDGISNQMDDPEGLAELQHGGICPVREWQAGPLDCEPNTVPCTTPELCIIRGCQKGCLA